MDLRLHACAYAFHTLPFKTSYTPPPFFLFRLQVVGSCRALVNGKLSLIETGDLLIYRPGDPYHLVVEEQEGKIESGDYYLLCEGAWIEDWWNAARRTTQQRIHLDTGLLALWQQLCIEQHRIEHANSDLIQHLLCALCLSMDRLLVEGVSLQNPKRSNELVMRMQYYINENALSPLTVEEVANFSGLSISRAVHLFKEITGYTIIHFTQEIRLSNALERIRYTDLSLENISSSCGFGTYSYFHKIFKAKYGVSPKEIRKHPIDLDRSNNMITICTDKNISGLSLDAQRFLSSGMLSAAQDADIELVDKKSRNDHPAN